MPFLQIVARNVFSFNSFWISEFRWGFLGVSIPLTMQNNASSCNTAYAIPSKIFLKPSLESHWRCFFFHAAQVGWLWHKNIIFIVATPVFLLHHKMVRKKWTVTYSISSSSFSFYFSHLYWWSCMQLEKQKHWEEPVQNAWYILEDSWRDPDKWSVLWPVRWSVTNLMTTVLWITVSSNKHFETAIL